MAAEARDVSVLSTVVQAYKKAGLLAAALSTTTQDEDGTGSTPLHVAVSSSSYKNTVLLLKECQEHCPEALTATRNGIQYNFVHVMVYIPLSRVYIHMTRFHTHASGCSLVSRG